MPKQSELTKYLRSDIDLEYRPRNDEEMNLRIFKAFALFHERDRSLILTGEGMEDIQEGGA